MDSFLRDIASSLNITDLTPSAPNAPATLPTTKTSELISMIILVGLMLMKFLTAGHYFTRRYKKSQREAPEDEVEKE